MVNSGSPVWSFVLFKAVHLFNACVCASQSIFVAMIIQWATQTQSTTYFFFSGHLVFWIILTLRKFISSIENNFKHSSAKYRWFSVLPLWIAFIQTNLPFALYSHMQIYYVISFDRSWCKIAHRHCIWYKIEL